MLCYKYPKAPANQFLYCKITGRLETISVWIRNFYTPLLHHIFIVHPSEHAIAGRTQKKSRWTALFIIYVFSFSFYRFTLIQTQKPLTRTYSISLPQDSGQVPSHRQRHLHGWGRTYPPPSAPLYPAFPDKRHVINEGNRILIQCLPAADAVRKEHHIVDTQKQ